MTSQLQTSLKIIKTGAPFRPRFQFLFITLFLFMFNSVSFAYLGTIDSGELVPLNQYRLILEPQLSPFNLDAHFDAGISDSSQLRVSLGAGESATHFDFGVKYIPYPDIDNQPAIGYKAGVLFASEKGNSSSLTLRFTPLISKSFVIDKNHWTPYAALPLGVSVQKSTSKTPTHLAIGVELTPFSTPDMQFGAEIGASLRDSFSYVSAFISFYFEPKESETN